MIADGLFEMGGDFPLSHFDGLRTDFSLARLKHYTGTPVDDVATAVALMRRLAWWFVDAGGLGAGRMQRFDAPLPAWAPATTAPAETAEAPAES